jgi:hypothetical protein
MKMVSRRWCQAGAAIAAAATWTTAVAQAQPPTPYVSSHYTDSTTKGNWPGTYGSCFFLVPQEKPRLQTPEIQVGPSLYSTNWQQYEHTATIDGHPASVRHCLGGAFASLIDWRVFTGSLFGGLPNPVIGPAHVYSLCEADATDPACDSNYKAELHASQVNACENVAWPGETYNGTWDSDLASKDPLSVELTVNVAGDATFAYYFIDAAGVCRNVEWTLYINGAPALDVTGQPVEGSIADFAGGKYEVFDIVGLEAGTKILLEGRLGAYAPACSNSGKPLMGVNTHISSVFVNGDCVLPGPAVRITKYTSASATDLGADGNDPNAGDIPNIAINDPVYWTYKIENIGDVPVLRNEVWVLDNQPGVAPTYSSGDDGDNVFEPGETWFYRAQGLAANLAAPPAGIHTMPDKCTHNGSEPERTAYVNLGTVIVSGASDSDPSSYCNPPAGPCQAVIGDFVWYDLNLNGIQDAGEPGIANVVVELLDGAGTTVLQTTKTDASGLYQFPAACGSYRVRVTPPAAPAGEPPYVLTTTSAPGSGPANDSNPNPSPVNLVAGGSDPTVDFGFVRSMNFCPLEATNPAQSGTLYYSVAANGDVYVRYDQKNDVNDNSYGVNAVGWPSGHTFGNLVGSDQAVFEFRDSKGNVVLAFDVDYISLKTGTPSGYDSLGVLGGEGNMNVGSASHVLFATSSLAQNLNTQGFCLGGNCTVAGVNLLANSPPTVSSSSYTLPAGSPFANWNFTNSYIVKVGAAAFETIDPGAVFGTVVVTDQHNSPAKRKTDGLTMCPVNGGNTGGAGACAVTGGTGSTKDKKFLWPLTNGGSSKVTISAITLTWPAASGYLNKVKLDGAVVWDNTIHCVAGTCSATLSSAQLTSDTRKKSIDPGKTRLFTLEFQNTAASGPYAVTVDFGTGCSVTR